MKREFLRGLGLEEAIIDQIMKENGNDINSAKASAEAQMSVFKEENEKLTQNVTEWTNKYNTLQNDTKDYTDLKQFKASTLEKEERGRKVDFLKAQGCKHPELLVSQIDFSKATYDTEKNTYTGLDEVLKAKREAYADMFEQKGTQNPNLQSPEPSAEGGVLERYLKDHPEMSRF